MFINWQRLQMVRTGFIRPERWNALVAAVRSGTVTSVVGGKLARTATGTVITIDPRGGGAAAAEHHPWQVVRADEGEIKKIVVRPGTINSVVPGNIFTAFSIANSGLEFVVLTVTSDGSAVQSCTLSVESSQPAHTAATSEAAPNTFHDIIAVINDLTVYPVRINNLTAEVQEVIREGVENPAPGTLEYVPWYNWVIYS